ncbi:Cytochrome P450 [Lentzea albidocapillata subsp. violacea]|uniref:Cytochrome P450 n=1 Tax=Lentzea albidocapillata subsp. violacea TaxID=128104 RepID=A0A1G8Z5W7_9PSEU|nr:cytochrome P450 [Lentzea albidocapillata]SDK10471.1 Cytochrome P450 [Lentzea albidocapillata subsp. violacea]
MTGKTERTDVLIAGGGPVGMALAIDLTYRGIGCVVAEAGDGEVRHPKVSTIGPRSMELFRRWGLADAIRNAGWPSDHPLDIAWVTKIGGYELHRYRRGTAADRPVFQHTPEPDQICPAHWLNPVLAQATGAPLRLRTSLSDVTQNDDHVHAVLTDLDTGAKTEVQARYLVACDGAASPIRQACGIGSPARFQPQIFRNILFRAPELRARLGDSTALVHFLVRSPVLRFPLRSLDGDALFNMVVGVEDEHAERAEAQSLIRDAIAFETPFEVLSDGDWHLTHRVADRYRHGRVFLAGDAAHTLSPSGGFGLNTGIADAADLGWKIAATLGGWAGPRLLDSYEAERRPIAEASLNEANTNLRRTMDREVPQDIDGPDGEQARKAMSERLASSGAHREFDAPEIHFGLRYRSSVIVDDPGQSPAITVPDAAWRPGGEPGRRAAHAWWDATTSTLDLFGPGFVLLRFGDDERLPLFEAAFAERGVPLSVRHSDNDELAKLYDRAFVLVRPDGHVAWRGDALPDDPANLADTVRGAALQAPRAEMPTTPASVDSLPAVLAAGQVAPIVTVDYFGGTNWVVCDPDLARTALLDSRLSKDMALAPEWMRIPGAMLGAQPRAEVAKAMVMSEGAEHTRIRRLHAKFFTPRKLGEWGERITKLAEGLLDDLTSEQDEVNLVDRFTFALPLGFFSELIGVPPHLRPALREVTDNIIYSQDQDERAAGVGGLAGTVAQWAAEGNVLEQGFVTDLLAAQAEDAVSLNEVVTWTTGLIMAGYESTASLIASSIHEALRRPPGERPRTDAELGDWVEETLRVQPPLPHATWRFATEDVELGGYLIPKGAPVQVNLAAANRCPHRTAGDEFVPGTGGDNVSFGLGRHLCLGAPLARLEARIALGTFLTRFPHARLSTTNEVRWESDWIIRRISALPVVLSPAQED